MYIYIYTYTYIHIYMYIEFHAIDFHCVAYQSPSYDDDVFLNRLQHGVLHTDAYTINIKIQP
jgi:hypothetical protein